MLGSLFNKVAKACNFIKKRLEHMFPKEIWKIFKNTYFEEHLLTAASKPMQFYSSNEQAFFKTSNVLGDLNIGN